MFSAVYGQLVRFVSPPLCPFWLLNFSRIFSPSHEVSMKVRSGWRLILGFVFHETTPEMNLRVYTLFFTF